MYIDTTNNMTGRICLNAEKADKLSTARVITLSGDVTGSTSFDGSKDITINSNLSNTGVVAGLYGLNNNTTGSHGTTIAIPYLNVDEDGRISSATNKTFTVVDMNDKVTQTVTSSNLNYPLLLAPNGQTNTTTTVSYFDSGVTLNPSTNTIAANISGNAATATRATQDGNGAIISSTYLKLAGGTMTGALNFANNTWNNVGDDCAIGDYNQAGAIGIRGLNGPTGLYFVPYSGSTAQKISINGSGIMTITGTVASTFTGNLSGNATTASTLQTARTISLTGDVTGSVSFNGGSNVSITAAVVDNSHNHTNYVPYLASGISDLNTMVNSGFYRVNSNLTNAPTGADWGQVLVIHGGGDTVTQIHGNYSNGNLHTRSGNSPDVGGVGSWTSWKQIWIQGNSVTGAVWNDYAEYREADCEEFGYVLMETGNDTLSKTTERLSHFAGVSSDTWGFSQGETACARTPIAVAGRVLVYPYQNRNNYKPGDCVCAAPGGTVDIMTREEVKKYPDRIVGTVSCVPEYEEWGGGENADRPPVKVNGRIWIKVK